MDKKIFEEIYKQHASEIYRFSFYKLNNKENAQDITSEVFIKMYTQDSNLEPNPRAWLFKSARNLIIDKHIRKESLVVLSEDQDVEEFAISMENIENQTLESLTIDVIKEKLSELDSETQDIVILRIWEDLKFSEIAQIVGKSENACKKRFYNGVKDLKQKVENSNNVSLKSVAIPTLMAGIFGITKQSAFAFTGAVSTGVAEAIAATLSINLLNMSGNIIAGNVGLGAIFSTLGAKLAVAGVAITAGLVGGFILLSSNNTPQQPENTGDEVVERDEDEVIADPCTDLTYSNNNFGNFSFKYSPCEWGLRDEASAAQLSSEGKLYSILVQKADSLPSTNPIAHPFQLDSAIRVFGADGVKEVYNLYVPVTQGYAKVSVMLAGPSLTGSQPDPVDNISEVTKVVESINTSSAMGSALVQGDEVIADPCTDLTYSNNNFGNFSFKYSPCEWELRDEASAAQLLSEGKLYSILVQKADSLPSTNPIAHPFQLDSAIRVFGADGAGEAYNLYVPVTQGYAKVSVMLTGPSLTGSQPDPVDNISEVTKVVESINTSSAMGSALVQGWETYHSPMHKFSFQFPQSQGYEALGNEGNGGMPGQFGSFLFKRDTTAEMLFNVNVI